MAAGQLYCLAVAEGHGGAIVKQLVLARCFLAVSGTRQAIRLFPVV